MIDLIARSCWSEKAGFTLKRDNIGNQYIFLHFMTPAIAILKNKSVEIKPGGCVIFAPFSRQILFSPECELLHDWFHTDPGFERGLLKYNIETEKVYYPSSSSKITELIRKLDSLQTKNVPLLEENLRCTLDEILIELAASLIEKNDSEPNKQNISLKNARAEILNNYSKDWNIQKMSELLRLSPSRFQHVYKEAFGISPIKELEKQRIHEAQILLLKTGYTLETIASMVGFGSQYNFIRQFKKNCGISPGKFRANNIL